MKKIFFLIILVALFYVLYPKVKTLLNKEEKFIYHDILTNTQDSVDVSKFTIYGKHLNMEGNLPSSNEDYEIVLKNNEEEIPVKIIQDDLQKTFKVSKYINDGINLENLDTKDYIFLLKNKKDNTYYPLVNKTSYHDNTYYTMTRKGKNNAITFEEATYMEKNYWLIKIQEIKLPTEIYDVIIDPGHGGIDTGASNGRYHESKYTLEYAKALQEALQEEGVKVKLTRETDVKIDHYGVGSRTGIPYEAKAKLMLSIHLNSSGSSKQKGVEIYKAFNDNDDYAKLLAQNIVNEVGTVYSNNPMHKVMDGVYMRVYSAQDKKGLIEDGKKGNFEPYEIDDTTTYYYFIRETGGISTKAFSDGRNPKYQANPYRNSNQGVEAYLCELAYISQSDDLKLVLNKKESFVKALTKSVLSYINDGIEEKKDNSE